jgi:nucleotide-binding universal stress UspA family protein
MAVINRILCPVDFSDASAHAVEQAAAIARWSGASVTALYVDQPVFAPVPALPAPVDRVTAPRIATVCERTRAFMQPALAAGLSTMVWTDVGDPVTSILERAARLDADLIVMGTHGAGGFERLILGSVTEKVLRKATCPVLTVPPRAHATSSMPFRRILCAVDFSEPAIDAVGWAASLARQSGASLDVAHVIEWPWADPSPPCLRDMPAEQAHALIEFRRYLTAAATRRLESVIALTVGDQCPARPHVCHGKPYEVILTLAAQCAADLIVLGVHGRRTIDLALLGSTTNQVVRRATCPVLTLRR